MIELAFDTVLHNVVERNKELLIFLEFFHDDSSLLFSEFSQGWLMGRLILLFWLFCTLFAPCWSIYDGFRLIYLISNRVDSDGILLFLFHLRSGLLLILHQTLY